MARAPRKRRRSRRSEPEIGLSDAVPIDGIEQAVDELMQTQPQADDGNPYDGTDDPSARTYSRRDSIASDEVQRLFQRMVESARDFTQNDLAPARERAWRYYNGGCDVPARKKRSNAVDAVVRDVVDGLMPQLIRVFCSTNTIGRYVASTGEDQQFADQATRYAQYVLSRQNNGFRVIYDHVKDGLIGGVAVIRTYCSHERQTTTERYENLTPDEFTLLMSDETEEIEVLEYETAAVVPSPPAPPAVQPPPMPMPPGAASPGGAPPALPPQLGGAGGPGQPPMPPPGPPPGGPGQPPMPPEMMAAIAASTMGGPGSNVVMFPGALQQPNIRIDCTIRRTHTKKTLCVDGVDPAEFIVDSRASTEDDARIIGMDAVRPVSDVVGMGVDVELLREVPSAIDDDRTGEKAARNPVLQSRALNDLADDERTDRLINVVDVVVRIDEDGDGVAERRHIIAVGPELKIVLDEPTDECCYAVGSPILIPHSIVGQSVASLVTDLQDQQSAILRQQLDSLYMATNPRYMAVETQVTLADLLDNQFGGVIRCRAPGMVQPFNTEFVGQAAFPMVERLDQIKENRTGQSKAAQGLDADALQSSTAIGVAAVIAAGAMKVELVARAFAETSIKRLFRQILWNAVRYQQEPFTITVDDKPFMIDPRAWKADMDVDVEVGLGRGNEDERRQALGMVLGIQKETLQLMGPDNPLCGLAELRNTLDDMLQLGPYKDTSRYFKPVTPQALQQWQQQQAAQAAAAKGDGPDPSKMADVQRKAQADQAKLQLAAQTGQQKLQLDQQHGQQRLALDAQKMQQQAELKRMQMLGDMQLDRERASVELQTDLTELQAEAALEKYKVDQQVKVDTRLRQPSRSDMP